MRIGDELPIGPEAIKELLEKTVDGVLVVDGDGTIIWANPSGESLFGRGRDGSLIGTTFGFPLVSGSNTEIDLIDASGQPAAAEMRVVSCEIEGERVSLAILRDLTERRRLYQERLQRERLEAERAQLSAERDRLEILARATKALDETLVLDEAVPAYLDVLVPRVADGMGIVIEPADEEGSSWFRTDDSIDASVWEHVLKGVRSSGGWRHDEGEDPQLQETLEFTSTPVLPLTLDKRVIGVIVALSRTNPVRGNDRRLLFSLRDSLQLALERSTVHRKITDESQLRDRFFAKVSHEIRNAVQALSGWSQVLTELLSPDGDVAAGFTAIENNAQLLRRLADDMIEVSEMLSGRISIRTGVVDVNGVVADVVGAMVPVAEDAGVELAHDSGSQILVEGDQTRLHQVFHNLIGNAIRYTPEGGHIRVSVEKDEHAVQIAVVDDGDGIDEADAEKLFSAFQQGKAGRGRRGGLGLGLTIAREIVSLHNGELSFHSDGLGKGTTFTVTIPLARFTDMSSSSADN